MENGETIAESHAIARYLGNEFELYGKSNHDKFVIDQTLDSLKNVEETLWMTYYRVKDPDAKVCTIITKDHEDSFNFPDFI